jgi:hypothetical protein
MGVLMFKIHPGFVFRMHYFRSLGDNYNKMGFEVVSLSLFNWVERCIFTVRGEMCLFIPNNIK